MKEGVRQKQGNFIATTLNGRVADKITELSNSQKEKTKDKQKQKTCWHVRIQFIAMHTEQISKC